MSCHEFTGLTIEKQAIFNTELSIIWSGQWVRLELYLGPQPQGFWVIKEGGLDWSVQTSLLLLHEVSEWSNNFIVLMVMRFFFGIGVGIISVIVPLFIIEISPFKTRGSFGVVCQLGITIGILFAYLFGLQTRNFKIGNVYWENFTEVENDIKLRLNFIVPVIPATIQIIALLFLYKLDTPKYYFIKGNINKVKESLNKIYPVPKSRRKSSSEAKINDSLFDSETINEDDVLELLDTNKDGRTFRSLRMKRYCRPFLIGIMIIVVQQFSGINLVIFFSSKFTFLTDQQTYGLTFLIGLINLIVTIAALFLYRWIGKKCPLLVGIIVMCACNCLLFSTYSQAVINVAIKNESLSDFVNIVSIILILVFIIAYALTLGPVSWIYLPEIMTEIGLGIAVGIHWFIVILISYLPGLGNKIKFEEGSDYEKYHLTDISPFFFIFGGSWIIGFFLIALFIKETKGLKPQEIWYMYQDQSYNALIEN